MKEYKGRPIVEGRPYEYVYFPEHHLAQKDGTVAVHILVSEEILGRNLERGMIPHHLDANKKNNTPENLMVFANQKEHSCYHACLRHNLPYELTNINGVFFCKNLSEKRRTQQLKQPRIKAEHHCPVCGIKKERNNKICINCFNKKKHQMSACPTKTELSQMIAQHSFEEIGRMYGVTGKAVRKWCDKYNIKKETQHPMPSEKDLVELLLNNSRKKTAEYYGVDAGTIKLWEQRYGISYTSGNKVKCIETNEVFQTKKEGGIKMYPDYESQSAAHGIARAINTGNDFNGYHWVAVPKTIFIKGKQLV